MKVFQLLWLIFSVAQFQAAAAEELTNLYFNDCLNVRLVFKNAVEKEGGFVALRYEVRLITKKKPDEALKNLREISLIEERSKDGLIKFYNLQFKTGASIEFLKMNSQNIKNNSFRCKNDSFAVETSLRSNDLVFRSEVKDTNFCEDHQLRKIDSNFTIFASSSRKKLSVFAADQSFEVEETAFGVLSIAFSAGFDKYVKELAEDYKKKHCPHKINPTNVIGYLIPTFFALAVTGYSCSRAYKIFRNRASQLPTIIQVSPYVP